MRNKCNLKWPPIKRWQRSIYNGIPETFIWWKMWKTMSFFQHEKCLFLCVSPLLLINKECTSHICRETTNDNIHFVEAKALISNSFLTIQSYKRNHCKSDIAIFAWRVTWNYAYSPFKFLRIEILKAPASLHTSIEPLMLMISLTLDTISWS